MLASALPWGAVMVPSGSGFGNCITQVAAMQGIETYTVRAGVLANQGGKTTGAVHAQRVFTSSQGTRIVVESNESRLVTQPKTAHGERMLAPAAPAG